MLIQVNMAQLAKSWCPFTLHITALSINVAWVEPKRNGGVIDSEICQFIVK